MTTKERMFVAYALGRGFFSQSTDTTAAERHAEEMFLDWNVRAAFLAGHSREMEAAGLVPREGA